MAGNNFNPRYFSMLARCMKKRDELRGIYQQDEKDQDPQEEENVIHTCFSSLELKLLIREFNPSKDRDLYATEWIREIEQLGVIHNWDPGHKLLYASMRLGGIAKCWYQYSIKSINNWEDFKKGLMGNFPKTVDAAEIHSKLIAKKRRSVETLEEYFHTTVQLGKRIKLSDDSIKDYLIRGLDQPKHQLILSSIGPCSLGGFLQHIQRLETDLQNSSSCPPTFTQANSKEVSSDRLTASTSRYQSTEKSGKHDRESFALSSIKEKKRPTIPNNIDSGSSSKPKSPNLSQQLTVESKKEDEKLTTEDDDKDWVLALQNKDPTLVRCRQILNGTLKNYYKQDEVKNTFRLLNGRLYSCQKDGLRFVVPQQDRQKIIESFHSVNGHLSTEKCIIDIKKLYWFPSIITAVKKFTKNCAFCTIRKLKPEKTLYEIYTEQQTPIPFHAICIDFCGAFPKTAKNNQYVFSVIDRHTKFNVLQAVADLTMNIAMTVIDLIAEYFGMPFVVISKDSEIFKSQDFKKYCNDNGIQHILIPDDATEVLNCLRKKFEPINNSVSELLTKDPETNWDEKLKELQMLCNNRPHYESHNYYQNKLLEYDPKKTFSDKLYEAIKNDREDLKKSVEKEVSGGRSMEDVEEVTDENHTESVNAEETPKLSAIFNAGDLILARHTIFKDSQQTIPCYRGPYIIKKILPRGRYLVTDTPLTQITSKRFNKIFPCNLLKKWPNREDLERFTKLLFDETDDK